MQIVLSNSDALDVIEVRLTVDLNRFPLLYLVVDQAAMLQVACERSEAATLNTDSGEIPIQCQQLYRWNERDTRQRPVVKEALIATVCPPFLHAHLWTSSQYAATTRQQVYQRRPGENAWAFIVRSIGGPEDAGGGITDAVNQVAAPELGNAFMPELSVLVHNPVTPKIRCLEQTIGWLRKRSDQFIGLACRPLPAQGIELVYYNPPGPNADFGIAEGLAGWTCVPSSHHGASGRYWRTQAARAYVHRDWTTIEVSSLLNELLGVQAGGNSTVYPRIVRLASRLHLVARTEYRFDRDNITDARAWVVPMDEMEFSYPSLPESPLTFMGKNVGWNDKGSHLGFEKIDGDETWQIFEDGNTPANAATRRIFARYKSSCPPHREFAGWYAPPPINQECELEILIGSTPNVGAGTSQEFKPLASDGIVINAASVQVGCSSSDTSLQDQSGIKSDDSETRIKNNLDIDGAEVRIQGDVRLEI